MSSRWWIVGLSFAVLLVSSPEAGAADKDHVARAGVLHKKAMKAYRGDNIGQAIDLWKAAEALDPQWKYAFNLASAYLQREEWIAAWDATNRAKAHGVPEKRLGLVEDTRGEVVSRLSQTHSQVMLDVQSTNATVLLNDRPWDTPRDTWVAGPTCKVEIDAPGHVSSEFIWDVGFGQRVRREISLARLGVVSIVGGEDGSIVFVDGVSVGELGAMRSLELGSGEHTVRVVHEGRTLLNDVLVMDAGSAVSLVVTEGGLGAVPVTSVAPWVLVGGGAAIALVGGVFTSQASAHQDDLVSLVENNESGFSSGQKDEYAGLIDERDSDATVSYAMYGMGGAAIVAGIVWLALDSGGEELREAGERGTHGDGKGDRTVQWVLGSDWGGGFSAAARWRF